MKNQEIENWINKEFGFFSYFEIRSLVKSAMDNNLANEYPNVPYTAKEILIWANWNDKDSFLFTPGGQAISGQTVWQDIAGTPEINPMTQKRNTQTEIDGTVVTFVKSGAMPLFYTGLALGGIVLLYQFSSTKVKKLGAT